MMICSGVKGSLGASRRRPLRAKTRSPVGESHIAYLWQCQSREPRRLKRRYTSVHCIGIHGGPIIEYGSYLRECVRLLQPDVVQAELGRRERLLLLRQSNGRLLVRGEVLLAVPQDRGVEHVGDGPLGPLQGRLGQPGRAQRRGDEVGAEAGPRVAGRQALDQLPVDPRGRRLRGAGVADQVVAVPEAQHEGVEHLGRRGDHGGVVREGVAEAEPGEGRDDQVEGLVPGRILGLGEGLHQVREGEVGEGEGRDQQERQGVAVRRGRVDEVQPEWRL